MWLHYVAFEPDGDVLYFERDAAWQKGVVVPTRASNITVEIAGIDALWPEATQPQPSDKSTKTPDATAGGTVELGSPKRSPLAKKKRGRKPELTPKIEAAMREAIANGRYTKQALIDQGATNALATEFGASRTPIRTVLNKLALEE